MVLPTTISDTAARTAAHMHDSEVVLLYFRGFGTCRFSARDVVELEAETQLAYPIDVHQPLTATAYLITREACRRLAQAIVPVRVAADNWGYFYELGALDALRCVIPRPVTVRKDFKSTIDYGGAESMRMRATSFVVRHKLIPFFQLLTLNRYLIERRMSRARIVPDPSPIALARSAAAR